MASISNKVWSAVVDAENAHSEGAERHARRQADLARAKGDAGVADMWDAAADTLHTLHSINRRRVRARFVSPGPTP